MIPSRGCSPGDPGATLHAYVHHTTPGGIRLLGRIALNSPEGCLPSSSVRVNSEPVILMCTSQSLHHPPAGARASQNLLTGGFLPQASQRLLLLVWLTGVLTGLQQLCGSGSGSQCRAQQLCARPQAPLPPPSCVACCAQPLFTPSRAEGFCVAWTFLLRNSGLKCWLRGLCLSILGTGELN